MTKTDIKNHLELPNELNINESKQIPEIIKEEKEEKSKEEIKQINIIDDIIISNNIIDLKKPEYLLMPNKIFEKEINIPQLTKYYQLINPISNLNKTKIEYNINYIEKFKEHKDAEIKSNYINKYPSIPKTNLNNLPILQTSYQLVYCSETEIIEESKKGKIINIKEDKEKIDYTTEKNRELGNKNILKNEYIINKIHSNEYEIYKSIILNKLSLPNTMNIYLTQRVENIHGSKEIYLIKNDEINKKDIIKEEDNKDLDKKYIEKISKINNEDNILPINNLDLGTYKYSKDIHNTKCLIPSIILKYRKINVIETPPEIEKDFNKFNSIQNIKEIKNVSINKKYFDKKLSNKNIKIDKLSLIKSFYKLPNIETNEEGKDENEIIDNNKNILRNRNKKDDKKRDKDNKKTLEKELKNENKIKNENIINNNSLLNESENIDIKETNQLELPNQINAYQINQIPEVLNKSKETFEKEYKKGKEKINILDNISVVNTIDFNNPNYLFERNKAVVEENNIPKMIDYIQIMNPIEKKYKKINIADNNNSLNKNSIKENTNKYNKLRINKVTNEFLLDVDFHYGKINHPENLKQQKEIEIIPDYINKYNNIQRDNLNNLPILSNSYQLCLDEMKILETIKIFEHLENINENQNIINNDVIAKEDDKNIISYVRNEKLRLPKVKNTTEINQNPEKIKASDKKTKVDESNKELDKFNKININDNLDISINDCLKYPKYLNIKLKEIEHNYVPQLNIKYSEIRIIQKEKKLEKEFHKYEKQEIFKEFKEIKFHKEIYYKKQLNPKLFNQINKLDILNNYYQIPELEDQNIISGNENEVPKEIEESLDINDKKKLRSRNKKDKEKLIKKEEKTDKYNLIKNEDIFCKSLILTEEHNISKISNNLEPPKKSDLSQINQKPETLKKSEEKEEKISEKSQLLYKINYIDNNIISYNIDLKNKDFDLNHNINDNQIPNLFHKYYETNLIIPEYKKPNIIDINKNKEILNKDLLNDNKSKNISLNNFEIINENKNNIKENNEPTNERIKKLKKEKEKDKKIIDVKNININEKININQFTFQQDKLQNFRFNNKLILPNKVEIKSIHQRPEKMKKLIIVSSTSNEISFKEIKQNIQIKRNIHAKLFNISVELEEIIEKEKIEKKKINITDNINFLDARDLEIHIPNYYSISKKNNYSTPNIVNLHPKINLIIPEYKKSNKIEINKNKDILSKDSLDDNKSKITNLNNFEIINENKNNNKENNKPTNDKALKLRNKNIRKDIKIKKEKELKNINNNEKIINNEIISKEIKEDELKN